MRKLFHISNPKKAPGFCVDHMKTVYFMVKDRI